MNYIKTYENFKSPDDWQIGDIVVAIETIYATDSRWLHKDRKYQIIEYYIGNYTGIVKTTSLGSKSSRTQGFNSIKVKELNFDDTQITDADWNGVLETFFSKNSFITLEEWELKQDTNKYNL